VGCLKKGSYIYQSKELEIMTQEKADLINRLMDVEEEIQVLWDYHPENPNAVDVVDRFNELQKLAISIESYLETLWTPEDDEDII
jgi:hypothetical protein